MTDERHNDDRQGEDRRWQAELRRLPDRIEPRRDLWPAIEARLGPRAAQDADAPRPAMDAPRRARFPAWALAASVAMAFFAGLLLGRLPGESGPAAPSGEWMASAPTPGTTATPAAWSTTLAAAEREYRSALLAFTPLMDDAPLADRAATGEIRGSWEAMQSAETELLDALASHPEHRFLVARLIDLRARQLDFLRRLYRLEQQRMARSAPAGTESAIAEQTTRRDT
jgi:hypothetical protein